MIQRPLSRSMAGMMALSFFFLLPSCLSYATGTSRPNAPSDLGTTPPAVPIQLSSISSLFQRHLDNSLTESGLFQGTSKDPESAGVVLYVDLDEEYKMSRWVYLNAAFLGFLPLPAERITTTLEGRMRVGTLEMVDLPEVRRVHKSWGGVALLPLSFIQHDHNRMSRRMVDDLVNHMAREYSALHKRTWEEASQSSAPHAVEKFLQSFPESQHKEAALVKLEGSLYSELKQGGTAKEYLHYLNMFPDSIHADDVKVHGAEPAWRDLGANPSEADLEGYLKHFEASPFAPEAMATLESLQWERLQSATPDLSSYRAFLDRFPSGANAAACRDAVAWGAAEEAHTPAAVAQYVENYPAGTYINNALAAQQGFQKPRLMQVTLSIPSWVDDSIRGTVSRIPTDDDGVMGGVLDHNLGTTKLYIEYNGEYVGGVLNQYTIVSGTVRHERIDYRYGADGRWYPSIRRIFALPKKD